MRRAAHLAQLARRDSIESRDAIELAGATIAAGPEHRLARPSAKKLTGIEFGGELTAITDRKIHHMPHIPIEHEHRPSRLRPHYCLLGYPAAI